MKVRTILLLKTENTLGSLELVAYCWLGYLKKSRSNVLNISKKQTEARDEAVDNDLMREQHPSMPINIDRQTRVTFGGTKKS
jgi:hypothetical protein